MSQQVVFCHSCQRRDVVDTARWTGGCQYCNSSFTEVLGPHPAYPPGARPRVRVIRNVQGARGGGTPHPAGPQGAHPLVQLLTSLTEDYVGMGGRMAFDMGGGSGSEEDFISMMASRIMDEYQPHQTPTAARVRRALPTFVVRPAGAQGEPGPAEACCFAGEPCAVCHDEFDEGLKVAELPCSHCFHSDCLAPWLETHNTCPVCRIELPEEGS